jgi:phosphomannomutase
VIKLDLDIALAAGIVHRRDMTNEYVDAVEALIDLETIRNANLKVVVDPMYGVGQLTLGMILTEARCRVTFIHERHDPLFGGRSPAPNLEALRLLIHYIQEGSYDLGLATDGDADRIAIIDEKVDISPPTMSCCWCTGICTKSWRTGWSGSNFHNPCWTGWRVFWRRLLRDTGRFQTHRRRNDPHKALLV